MSTNIDKKVNKILEEFKEEQQKTITSLINKQNKKTKRIIIFMIVFSLVLSGISGVASYTLAASDTSYTAKDTSWTVDNTQDAIDELRDTVGYALVGSIFSYMGNNAPFGYLKCDGSEYNIADYPRLAEHFTSEFGSANYFGGDGSTTFKVPDLRGEFLRGTGTNSHTNQGSGATVGTHQDGTNEIFLRTDGTNAFVGQAANGIYEPKNYDFISARNRYLHGTMSGNKGSATYPSYYTARPTNTSVLYIIKY